MPSPDHAPDGAVRAALARALGARVIGLERRPSPYRSSFRLEELDVVLDDGRELALTFKDTGPGGMTPAGRAAKPALVRDPLRELEVYERILAPAALGTAALHGADRRRGWLFLERVPGVPLWQAGDPATWEEAARWLARAHAALAGAAAAADRLLRHDARLLRLWPRRAALFAGGRDLRRIAAGYEAVAARLLTLPVTLLHGDLYASNVLVDAPLRPSRICPVDWEMAGVGPALLDLAALVSGWPEADRRRIGLAYREAISLGERPEQDDFLAALDACGLHVALQWLGWAPGWRPPAEHDHDWRADALELAERVGV